MAATTLPVLDAGPGHVDQLFELGKVSASFVANDTVEVSWGDIYVPPQQGTMSLKITAATNQFFNNPQIVPAPDTTKSSVRFSNPEYKYSPEVWVHLVATLTSPNSKESQTVPAFVTASHIATLQPVTNIKLGMVQPSGVSRVSVSFDLVPTYTTYDILIHSSGMPNPPPLYQATVDAGSGTTFSTEVDLFSSANGMPINQLEKAVCKVTTVSLDATKFTNSAPAEASSPFSIIRYIPDITATQLNNTVTLTWAQTGAKEFRLRASFKEDTYVMNTLVTPTNKTASQPMTYTISLLQYQLHNGPFNIALQPVGMVDGSYVVSTMVPFELVDFPTIDYNGNPYAVFCDEFNESLTFPVNANNSAKSGVSFVAQLQGGTDADWTSINQKNVTFNPTIANFAGNVVINNFKLPCSSTATTTSVRMVTVDNGDVHTFTGSPITLSTPANLPSPLPPVTNIKAEIISSNLNISWDYPSGNYGSKIYVTGLGPPYSTLGDPPSDQGGVITPGNTVVSGLPLVSAGGTVLSIKIVTMYGASIYGTPATYEFTVPKTV